MILRQPGVGVKECQVWQPIEQVFLMDAAGSVSPDDGAKNTSVVYASANGDNVKVTVNGAGDMGKLVHTGWTGNIRRQRDSCALCLKHSLVAINTAVARSPSHGIRRRPMCN